MHEEIEKAFRLIETAITHIEYAKCNDLISAIEADIKLQEIQSKAEDLITYSSNDMFINI